MTGRLRGVTVALLLYMLLIACCSGKGDKGRVDRESGKAEISEKSRSSEFHFTTLNGNSVPLSKFRGRTVFIIFFNTRSKECIEQIEILEKFYERYRRYGVSVLGIPLDKNPGNRLRLFVEKHGITFPVYINGREVSGYFGGIGITPTILIIGSNGSVYEKVRGKKDFKFLQDKLKEVRSRRL